MVLADTMPAKISTEPTDRSMPPVMITNVMPTASTSSTAVSMARRWKLNTVGNAFGRQHAEHDDQREQHQRDPERVGR